MQVIWCKTVETATNRRIATTKAFWIAMFQCSIVVLKKNWISSWKLKLWSQRTNLTFVPYSFDANFLSYISAKYCLNWFSFHIFIVKVIARVNFFKNTVYINYRIDKTFRGSIDLFSPPAYTCCFRPTTTSSELYCRSSPCTSHMSTFINFTKPFIFHFSQ